MVFQKGNQINKGKKNRLGHKHNDATKKKISEALRGVSHPQSKETRMKISKTHQGITFSDIHKQNLSLSHKGKFVRHSGHFKKGQTSLWKGKEGLNGERNGNWKGGIKVAWARQRHKRRERGFSLITCANPYNEPIEYHHIHPDLPYVVPCPTRIHKMFPGGEKSHFQNVNAMLGFRFEVN